MFRDTDNTFFPAHVGFAVGIYIKRHLKIDFNWRR